MPAEIQIEARRAGIFIPEADLWLDPRGKQNRAFISHAHADHYSRPQQAICSPETAHLLRKRFGLKQETLDPINPGETGRLGGFTLRLLPAGHIVGSSMLHLTRESDGASLLYTGDFKTRSSLTCEPARPISATTLIIETTFGTPTWVFPPRAEIEEQIIRFIHQAIEDGQIPILCVYSLGKAQELSALLANHQIPFQAHPTIIEMNDACRELGVDLPSVEPISGIPLPGHALLCPPAALRSKRLRQIGNRSTAMISGWGLLSNSRYRYQVDRVIPLSDHADYRELLAFVEAVNPTTTHTVHGFTREFAADLRSRHRHAWSLFGSDQLELLAHEASENLSLPEHSAVKRDQARPLGGLTQLVDQLATESSHQSNSNSLASFLSSLGDCDFEHLVPWLTRRPAPLDFGLPSIRRSLLEAFSIPLAEFRAVAGQQQDLALTARALSTRHGNQRASQPLSYGKLSRLIQTIDKEPKKLGSITLLATSIRHLSPEEVELVIRILTRTLPTNGKHELVENALSKADGAILGEIKRAHALTGDLAHVARLSRKDQLAEARPQIGNPLRLMQPSAASSAAEIWSRLTTGQDGILVEAKIDGIRAQLHKKGRKLQLFSTNGDSIGSVFPEILQQAGNLPDCVLDGMIVSHQKGKVMTPAELKRRLGKKPPPAGQTDLFAPAKPPTRFIIFDLLAHRNQDYWQQPLHQRKELLGSLQLDAPFEQIASTLTTSADEIESQLKLVRKRGHSGLIAKGGDDPYPLTNDDSPWLVL